MPEIFDDFNAIAVATVGAMSNTTRQFFADWWRRLTSSPNKMPAFAKPAPIETPSYNQASAVKSSNPISSNQTARERFFVAGSMLTDVGRVRNGNEDKVLYVAPEAGSREGKVGFLALVADGMGGHAAGEVASEMAAELIRDLVYSSREAPPQVLSNAFHTANRAIFERSQDNPELQGMGTTCTAILIRDELLYLAQIGDSRAYLWRDNLFHQLSDDQTLHAKLIREGLMTKEEALTAPGGNFILQALGARENIDPTISEGMKLQGGDKLLLCSDGLYSFVKDEEIAGLVSVEAPAEACQHLIDAANEAGGTDNISVGIFHISSMPPLPPTGKREQASDKPIFLSPTDEA